jgi:hypothetical protein
MDNPNYEKVRECLNTGEYKISTFFGGKECMLKGRPRFWGDE